MTIIPYDHVNKRQIVWDLNKDCEVVFITGRFAYAHLPCAEKEGLQSVGEGDTDLLKPSGQRSCLFCKGVFQLEPRASRVPTPTESIHFL